MSDDPTKKAQRLIVIVFGLFLIGLAGYMAMRGDPPSISWEEHNQKMKELDGNLRKLRDEVKVALGTGQCEDSTQCRIAGFGMKTCGYNIESVIYSTKDVKEPALLQLIERFNQTHTEFMNFSMKVPRCGKPLPAVTCIKGFCDFIRSPGVSPSSQ